MTGREAAFAAAVAGLLAGYNNTGGGQPWRQRWYPAINLGATGALLAAATASGLTAADLGLSPGRVPAGLRGAAGPAGALAAAWLGLAAAPATRPVLADQRVTGLTWPQLAYQVTVRIPVGTVLWEETAFRGVLQAALRRVLPGPAAIAVTGGMFGIWHVRPTMAALRVNGIGGADRGRPPGLAQAAAVAGAVLATAVAGVVLSGFRDRSGSVAGPVLLHLTANCGAALAARTAAGARQARAGR
ncbi:MAG TPA: CPBP family intramembrane glutamic endopeptidase [Streptosporangiaceae bacterium]|nr:CPBP family intramembrane glutamic endopeptidase [Streptosporangiaceae bacterium]